MITQFPDLQTWVLLVSYQRLVAQFEYKSTQVLLTKRNYHHTTNLKTLKSNTWCQNFSWQLALSSPAETKLLTDSE